jgi:hypothetical protein
MKINYSSYAEQQEIRQEIAEAADRESVAIREALSTLLDVCERMDCENDAERPDEAEYQAAIAAARKALGRE